MDDTIYRISFGFTKRTWIFVFSLFLTFSIKAYNLRQLSSREGLSNSAILSICRDSERFMWFGSVDGLNVYNGVDIHIFKPDVNVPGSLSGNLIEEVREGENGIIWINTNHGLNRYNKKTREIECHEEFEGKYFWAKTSTNEVFTIHEDNAIDYYDKADKRFISLSFPNIIKSDIQRIFIDRRNRLWVVTNKGIIQHIMISFKDGKPQLTSAGNFLHDSPVRYAFEDNGRIYFIDSNYFLFETDSTSDKKTFIMNLRKEIEGRGIVSSILKDNDDYLVAFQTNGLIRLRNTPEHEIKYRVEPVDIFCGVFSLLKDDEQDIIWIGTDGQGVYIYTRDMFSIRSATFDHLQFSIQKPVRALFLDNGRNLWVGTKDDGILMVEDYDNGNDLNTKRINHIITTNSVLTNNSVYAFGKSDRNILWIGGDGPGLNYYSFKDKKVKRLASQSPEPIFYVHSICEVNDSTLWLASVGAGIFKIILGGSMNDPYIKSIKRFTFVKDEMSYNYFFTACRENDSILWFGNRGYGLQRLNLKTEKFDEVRFYKKDIRTINDILSIYKDSKGNIWVGTSFGVLKLLEYNPVTREVFYENYNEIEGLPNNTIHGIQEDDDGFLWLSTNGGVARFDTDAKNFRVYNHKSGLNVFEFSDGAYLRDDKTGTLFFGGTNGFVMISPDMYANKKFVPDIYFTGLKIYENEYNLNDLIQPDAKGEFLKLKYDQNFFSISFIALDYLNGQNCRYYYNLENLNDKWIDNGTSNMVNFTNVPPGEYVLRVKCNNGNLMTDIYSLRIKILPPWYQTAWAYAVYTMLFLLSAYITVQTVRWRYRLKRESIIEKMNQQQKEEIYESKLRFFTNITHEFSTPLTLIYGPCDRILSYEKSDGFVKKYAQLIMKNAERLHSLIQELIEFRRIETGHKSCVIARVDISDSARTIADSFLELSESKGVHYEIDIEDKIGWNTDENCFTIILTNLLSNAFKYTPDNGKIILKVYADMEIQTLKISVANTGKGIKEEDIPLIFDRYSVLENFEKQTQKGIFARNGLGLSICHSMVKLLNGTIDVRSIPGEYAEFRVSLPSGEITENVKSEITEKQSLVISANPLVDKPVVEVENNTPIKSKLTVFVIDDDPEMRWFVSDILKKQYNVVALENAATVLETMETIQPHLIISDIMMPEMDGISLMKQIKANRRTSHVPFILLSAKNTPEEQTEGIAAGAEAYIVKPFNVEYILSVAEHLIQRQNDLEDYYHSAISAYEFMDGKFIHKEHKKFFERILFIIDKNLTNPDFSTEQLASEMGVSSRHLYRKLKIITDQTPADLIKKYRLVVVEKLLITSLYSVDEVMYKAGFNNRGSFYRIFQQKFGTTPKKYREMKTN
ncbi:hybrid sensor histidine kinase/response regulator [Bacteroidia bacterium]|nr:hybrid sensor histidine kinase/response regulator [Bacteroidia bacterium]